jgi:hypothetical protein
LTSLCTPFCSLLILPDPILDFNTPIIALDNEERQTKENIRDDVILHFKESNKTVSYDLFQKAWKKAATPERMRAGRRKKDIKISKEK